MAKKIKAVAFWSYDLFPYYLWGEIDMKIIPKIWKGKMAYYIPSYQGYFCPKFILQGKEAEVMMNKLSELKVNKRKETDVINKKYQEQLDNLIKGL